MSDKKEEGALSSLITHHSSLITDLKMNQGRRFFMKQGGLALTSVGLVGSAPSFLRRVVEAQGVSAAANGRRKTLISIFQRGAVDGLNMVVPHGERAYYELRPQIAIAQR